MARTSNPNPYFLGYFVNEAAIIASYASSFKGAYVFNADTGTVWLWNGSAWVDTTNAIWTAAGANTQIQYNDNGFLGADAALTFNGTTLAVDGDIAATGEILGDTVVSTTSLTADTVVATTSVNTAAVVASGDVNAATYSVGILPGASGSFTTDDAKTVTVVNGIITAIV